MVKGNSILVGKCRDGWAELVIKEIKDCARSEKLVYVRGTNFIFLVT